jgi:putative transposase
VAEALTQMFVSGTSTHKVGEVAATLMGVAPSASAVSRLNQTLTEQFEGWRERPLLVHKQRNVMNAIPHREQKEVAVELAGIWKQEKKEDALLNLAAFKAKYQKRYPEAIRSLIEDEEHLVTFYAFPPIMHRYIRSTNAIESFFSNVRQRTDQIDAFTTETSCLTIVWAVMQDIRLPKIPVS